MSLKKCPNGHNFEKTSNCPTCPTCAANEINEAYKNGFPKIGAPAIRALENANITVEDLPKYSQKELLGLHGFGPRALRILEEYLKEKGLGFLNN